MKFNIGKCVFMTVTNKTKPIMNNYHINNEHLSKKEMIKYLGVNIDSKLTFNNHIKEKSKKATTVLNMLKRNLYFAPRSVKYKAYQACILPIIEYASSCWLPTSGKQKSSLEMIHQNGAKFASNVYPKSGKFEQFSIHKILQDLNWKTLEERRINLRLIITYKIINGHVILDSNLMPKVDHQRPNRKCNEVKVGYQNQIMEPPWKIDVVKSTFFYAGPTLWNNNVTPMQAAAPSIDAFKQHLKNSSKK